MIEPVAEPARLPPPDLPGLDPSWSRLVHVPATDGVGRTWHLLDNGATSPSLTVLCVHGNPTWSYLFRRLVGAAPDHIRVIAVDQLDMGFSERTAMTRRLATRIDDLRQLTDELELDGPVVTVAHDWGGPISLGWARHHREQLRGVVLLNTAVHQPAGSPAPSLIRLARSRALLDNLTIRSTGFIVGALEMSRPRLAEDIRAAYLAPYLSPERRTAIRDFVADIPLSPDHPSADALDSITEGLSAPEGTPSLLLWGAADKVFSDLYLHDLESRFTDADVHRYPKAAHLVSEDVDVSTAIVDWLGSLDAPPVAAPIDDRDTTLLETHGRLGSKLAIAEMTGAAAAITFHEFAELVEQTAAGLAGAGIEPGDRVALMIPPGVDLAVTLYACWRAGAVIVLIDSGLGPAGMSAAIKVADPEHLVGIPRAMAAARALGWPGRRFCTAPLSPAQARLFDVVADIPAMRRAPGRLPSPRAASDPAAVVFTSGATGPSKGVRYEHRHLEAQRDALIELYGIGPGDRLVAAFAPFALNGPGLGVTSVVPDMDVTKPATLTAAALGDAAITADATLVFASPAALANVVRTAPGLGPAHRDAFARIRLLLSAGAPVRPSLLRAAADLFPNATAYTPYGMTECLPVASISLDEIEAAEGGDGVCVGFPLESVEVRIRPLDELGRATGDLTDAPGVLGEVVARAPHARSGYDRLWHTEFLASRPQGWHSTADVGHLDELGRLWIGGRLGHVIASEAGPIAPVRLEQAIETIDGVASATVVGVGPAGIEQLVAVVEPDERPRRPRHADLTLIDRVRATVDADIVAVFEVPRLPVDRRHNSKIDRTAVAAWCSSALAGGRLGQL